MTEDRLRTLLREAESAHAAYEQERGEPDDDWPAWYAAYIIARLQEEPEGAAHRLDLNDEELQLLAAAVHAYLDDFGHEEADVLRRVKEPLAKVQGASMVVRIVLWNLADSKTTIEELRRYLRDESVDEFAEVEGLRFKAWISDAPASAGAPSTSSSRARRPTRSCRDARGADREAAGPGRGVRPRGNRRGPLRRTRSSRGSGSRSSS